jgi:hypothetical protein
VSVTPAADLARLKVSYPEWKITQAADQYVAVSRETGRRLRAATVAGLEYLLSARRLRRRAERPPPPGG